MADDNQVESAGELAAELSGDGVTATVVTFPNTAVDSVDTGTNADTRTLQQTQGTPPLDQNSFGGGIFSGSAFQLGGVGAGRDDTAKPTSATNQILLNTNLNAPITPRPNVLDQFPSYTYSLSWYLLSEDQYNELIKTHKSNINTWELIMQSGGAPANVGPGGRNKYFTLDYYMDNLVMNILLPGKGNGASMTGAEFTFTVTEPNGLTLIQNLAKAAAGISQSAPNTNSPSSTAGNFQQAHYCLAIRFYGYDEAGNLVYPITGAAGGKSSPFGDPAAVVQRFYPFNLKDITFRLVNKVVEYTVTGLPVAYNQLTGADRATIPFPIALVGKTVDDVLNGKPITTKDNADDGRSSSNTVSTGPQQPAQPDDATTAALFNDGTGYTPGYDPAAGWGGG